MDGMDIVLQRGMTCSGRLQQVYDHTNLPEPQQPLSTHSCWQSQVTSQNTVPLPVRTPDAKVTDFHDPRDIL